MRLSSSCSWRRRPQVQGAERLVEQERLRAVDQRAGQRDALLLAAGELPGLALLHPGELGELERPRDPALASSFGDAAALQAEGDVALDVEVGEERVGLKDRVDVAAKRGDVGDVLAAEADAALVGSSKPPIIRSVVVLPQPEGPSSGEEAPARDLEVEGVDRQRSSKRLVTRSSTTSGAAVACSPVEVGVIAVAPIGPGARP
jgi:hypothetical protein